VIHFNYAPTEKEVEMENFDKRTLMKEMIRMKKMQKRFFVLEMQQSLSPAVLNVRWHRCICTDIVASVETVIWIGGLEKGASGN